ncbi:hypothetical protein, partial [Staphylococcus aureus]|uniref:hypothetical protein n=1 Tax=Staphylococcus aureus TaxID=1280 RepID=UPI0039BE8E5C
MYAGVLGASGVDLPTVLNNYMEGAKVSNLRVDGRKSHAPEAVGGGETYVTTYEDGGVVIWRPGSCSEVNRVHGDNFNNAPHQYCSGVPGTFYNLRGFY